MVQSVRWASAVPETRQIARAGFIGQGVIEIRSATAPS